MRGQIDGMEPRDLLTQMDVLDLSPEELADLVDRPTAWIERLIDGEQPIPHWLELLTLYRCEYDGSLKIAREAKAAKLPGGQTIEDVLDGERGMHPLV